MPAVTPPKRVTRSRAKAAGGSGAEEGAPDKAMATTTRKATTATTESRKRVVQAKSTAGQIETSGDDANNQKPKQTTSSSTAPTASSAGRRVAKTTNAAANPVKPAPKATKSAVESQASKVNAGTRGRAKAATKTQEQQAPAEAPAPARVTRARAASNASVTIDELASEPMKRIAKKPTAAKKKVTFSAQVDADDKENVEPSQATKDKTAKPARNAAQKTTRKVARPAALEVSGPDAGEERPSSALSPNKNFQVSVPPPVDTPVEIIPAEVDKTSIEDQEPARDEEAEAISKSPTKAPSDPVEPFLEASADVPAKDLESSPSKSKAAISSPTKVYIESPAKRAFKNDKAVEQTPRVQTPSSPKKRDETTKMSPVKALTLNPVKTFAGPVQGAYHESPRRPPPAAVPDTVTSPSKVNLMLDKAPVRLPVSATPKAPRQAGNSMVAAERLLFTSPAKRPKSPIKFLSPMKPLVLGRPQQGTESVLHAMTASGVSGTPRRPQMSPSKMVTSAAFSAVKTPAATAKVHRMTAEEQAQVFGNELASAPSPFSPVKRGKVAGTPLGKPGVKADALASSRSQLNNATSPIKSTVKAAVSKSPIKSGPSPVKTPSPSKTRGVLRPMVSADEGDASSNVSPLNLAYQTPARGAVPRGKTTTTHTKRNELSPAKEGPMTTLAKKFGQWQPTTPDTAVVARRKQGPSAFEVLEAQAVQNVQNDTEPATPLQTKATETVQGDGPMTVLAKRFDGWQVATPNADVMEKRRNAPSAFQVPEQTTFAGEDGSESVAIFEDANSMHVHNVEAAGDALAEMDDSLLSMNETSEVSQVYGDENEAPVSILPMAGVETSESSQEKEVAEAADIACTPARTLDAEKARTGSYTVSRVPLKDADTSGDFSPACKPARKAKSLGKEISSQTDLDLGLLRQMNPPRPHAANDDSANASAFKPGCGDTPLPQMERSRDSILQPQDPEVTPRARKVAKIASPARTPRDFSAVTPGRTPRADLNNKLLRGAVVFVDVHTTEGADASAIFVELLTGMGARCVKTWSWSIRGSSASSSGAVGITHVVFKDGGKRTMEKVREAKGLVQCIGVGWVLDCEAENRWVNEADYAIDVSTVPRGGHNRRKSMEPTSLSHRSSTSSASSRRSVSSNFGDLLSYSPMPASPATVTLANNTEPSTPQVASAELGFDSPATPYFLHPHDLVQQTCPPKQLQQPMDSENGLARQDGKPGLKQRLFLARRKSLQWAPKVASPLSRTHSFQ